MSLEDSQPQQEQEVLLFDKGDQAAVASLGDKEVDKRTAVLRQVSDQLKAGTLQLEQAIEIFHLTDEEVALLTTNGLFEPPIDQH